MSRGKIIVLEGLDGSGKCTQSKLLFNKIVSIGRKAKLVSMPNYESESSGPVKMYLNGEISDNLYDINSFASSSFFAVDRFINYFVSWKNLYENEGFDIICDRYSTSNMIFQIAKLDEKNWDDFLNWIHDYEYNKLNIPKPDVVIYLKVPLEISSNLVRLRSKNSDLHEKNFDFLERCSIVADYVSRKFGWNVINCSSDGIKIDSVGEISKKIFQILGI